MSSSHSPSWQEQKKIFEQYEAQKKLSIQIQKQQQQQQQHSPISPVPINTQKTKKNNKNKKCSFPSIIKTGKVQQGNQPARSSPLVQKAHSSPNLIDNEALSFENYIKQDVTVSKSDPSLPTFHISPKQKADASKAAAVTPYSQESEQEQGPGALLSNQQSSAIKEQIKRMQQRNHDYIDRVKQSFSMAKSPLGNKSPLGPFHSSPSFSLSPSLSPSTIAKRTNHHKEGGSPNNRSPVMIPTYDPLPSRRPKKKKNNKRHRSRQHLRNMQQQQQKKKKQKNRHYRSPTPHPLRQSSSLHTLPSTQYLGEEDEETPKEKKKDNTSFKKSKRNKKLQPIGMQRFMLNRLSPLDQPCHNDEKGREPLTSPQTPKDITPIETMPSTLTPQHDDQHILLKSNLLQPSRSAPSLFGSSHPHLNLVMRQLENNQKVFQHQASCNDLLATSSSSFSIYPSGPMTPPPARSNYPSSTSSSLSKSMPSFYQQTDNQAVQDRRVRFSARVAFYSDTEAALFRKFNNPIASLKMYRSKDLISILKKSSSLSTLPDPDSFAFPPPLSMKTTT